MNEDAELRVTLRATGGGPSTRVWVEGLPPGAAWDEGPGLLTFRPDFTQGGHKWPVRVTAEDGAARATGLVEIQALDSIRPPAPVVVHSEAGAGFTRLTVSQTTDSYLDSPGYAGRTFRALVTVPMAPSGDNPVRVKLHGLGGSPTGEGWSGEYRIEPEDPFVTYWWGYAEQLPARVAGAVPEYTARRVLHLLAWVLENHRGASAERVYLDGISMGASGAMTLGLLHARHFCHVRAFFGQAIPRNHRPSRLAQLAGHWGSTSANLEVWDRADLTRVLRDVPEARDQFLTLKHSKDDALIHFGAVVHPSPLTGLAFYEALQQLLVGHHAVWDEGGHDVSDPVLGAQWWTAGWDPVFDSTALVRRSQAFPAFSRASNDRDPGDGRGNGKQGWHPESGFSGQIGTPGDTGWSGDLAGALNRFLRWDATRLVDTTERFELPLRLLDGPGSAPPRSGYPTLGDKLEGTSPVLVDVTPRRVQGFHARPGEHLGWEFAGQRGVVTADASGAVTVPRLPLSTTWTTLRLTRSP